MAAAQGSETALAQRFDLCVADTLLKIGGGLVTGAAFSLFVFKRKSWPISIGLGWGAGMGYSNCQNLINQPYLISATRVKVKTNPQEIVSNNQTDTSAESVSS